MPLVVGLGNPGPKYQKTRHNVGRWVIDELQGEQAAGRLGPKVELGGDDWKTWAGVYMNELGPPLSTYLRRNGISPDQLLVIHDELDLPLGTARIGEPGRGSAGHKGIESLISALGRDFWRLRLGIGTPEQEARRIASETFVLQPFSPSELPIVSELVAEAVTMATRWAETPRLE